jgi:hypothetical protein
MAPKNRIILSEELSSVLGNLLHTLCTQTDQETGIK